MIRTVGATLGMDTEQHPPRAPMRPPPHGSSLRRSTVPRSPPGPRQERPSAGRSPGSRVDTRCTTFPGHVLALRPSGRPLVTRRPAHRAHRLQLQGQPRHWTPERPHRIPLQAPRGTDAICDTVFTGSRRPGRTDFPRRQWVGYTRARIACAWRRCGASIIRPSSCSAPASGAAANAATIASARATVAASGVKAALIVATWVG